MRMRRHQQEWNLAMVEARLAGFNAVPCDQHGGCNEPWSRPCGIICIGFEIIVIPCEAHKSAYRGWKTVKL